MGAAVMRAAILATCIALPAAAHSPSFTAEENAWLNRQRSHDGTKCCDETDAHVGMAVEWRMTGGRYEVRINGGWHAVPPGRVMQHNPSDPTPWPGQALLFYSPTPWVAQGFQLWCFYPEPLM